MLEHEIRKHLVEAVRRAVERYGIVDWVPQISAVDRSTPDTHTGFPHHQTCLAFGNNVSDADLFKFLAQESAEQLIADGHIGGNAGARHIVCDAWVERSSYGPHQVITRVYAVPSPE